MSDSEKNHAKAIFLTAASSGIGAVCAKTLAEQGFWVFAGVRNGEKGQLLQSQIRGHVTPVLLDVTNHALIHAAVQKVREMLAPAGGKLVGLVNNATNEHHGPLEILPLEIIKEEIAVDYLGALALIKAFLPLLRESQGRIINFSSMNGRCVFRSIGANSAAKYAIEAMSDALRLELSPWGIPVSLIEPGAVATPLWDKALRRFEALPSAVSPEQLQLYYPDWSAAVAQARADKEHFLRTALPPERIAQTILAALTSPRPKTRYIVGKDATTYIFLKWLLPDKWFDRVAKAAFRDQ